MSFTIVKINLNLDNCIFKTTHGNNLQFLFQLHSPSFCLILAQHTLDPMRTAVRTSFVHIPFHKPVWKWSRVLKCSVISVPDTKPQLEQAHSQVLKLSLKKSSMQKY